MSITVTRPRPRVSHPRGYRLTPMGDGVAATPDTRLVHKPPFYAYDPSPDADGPWIEKFDAERVKNSVEKVGRSPRDRFRREVDPFDTRSDHTVSTRKGRPKSATPKKPRNQGESSTQIDRVDIDAMIRSKGYTGPINAHMRTLMRDVISHNESLARYTGEVR
jgi:hypothetical protein